MSKKKNELNLFKIIDAITYTKKDLTNHPLFEKSYNPFMINRWLSMSPHTAWAAFFCDQTRHLSKAQHFRFLQSLVEPKKVYIKYKKGAKTADRKDLKIIQEYYEVGEKKASEIVDILNSGQLKSLRESFGGIPKKKR